MQNRANQNNKIENYYDLFFNPDEKYLLHDLEQSADRLGTYGSYGGIGHGDQTWKTMPLNEMDELFKQHDANLYDTSWLDFEKADEEDNKLLEKLKSLPNDPARWKWFENQTDERVAQAKDYWNKATDYFLKKGQVVKNLRNTENVIQQNKRSWWDRKFRLLYTGNENATDEVYHAALDAAHGGSRPTTEPGMQMYSDGVQAAKGFVKGVTVDTVKGIKGLYDIGNFVAQNPKLSFNSVSFAANNPILTASLIGDGLKKGFESTIQDPEKIGRIFGHVATSKILANPITTKIPGNITKRPLVGNIFPDFVKRKWTRQVFSDDLLKNAAGSITRKAVSPTIGTIMATGRAEQTVKQAVKDKFTSNLNKTVEKFINNQFFD